MVIIDFYKKLNRQNVVQVVSTCLALILTVLLPILGYIQFNLIIPSNIDLGNFTLKYNLIFISTIIIGALLSGLRYFLYRFQQFSVKRGIINLLSSVLYVVFLTITAQIGNIYIQFGTSSLSLNLTGVFIVLISVWSLLILKNALDLIDFKLNQSYYQKTIRSNTPRKKAAKRMLIDCPNCKYTCNKTWKKCPVCKTPL